MSAEKLALSELTDEAAHSLLRKAKKKGLTAIEAACLVYNKNPPPNTVPDCGLPDWIRDFSEKLEKEYPHSPCIHERIEDWRNALGDGIFGLPPDNLFTLETILQAIQEYDLWFMPDFLKNETNHTPSKEVKPEDSKPRKPRNSTVSEDNTLKALGVLAFIISKQSPRYRKGNGTPNASQIAEAILTEAQALQLDTHGLKSAIQEKITQAVALVLDQAGIRDEGKKPK